MRWQDEGIVIAAHKHGERGAILTLLTRDHGRHKGYCTLSPKTSSSFQVGTHVQAFWTARLPEHLGTWSMEVLLSPMAHVLGDSLKLGALTSACGLLEALLAEREPHEALFESLVTLIKMFQAPCWKRAYCAFEETLLREGGVRLQFDACTLTGARENLKYVSPRTGRAVTAEAGEPYKDKLLPLPFFLKQGQEKEISLSDFKEALDLYNYFFERYLLSVHHLAMPLSRERLKELIARRLRISKAS